MTFFAPALPCTSLAGHVMTSLASKAKHVPFRNSKLTRLLEDSLSGQAKSMMFIHVAPEVGGAVVAVGWAKLIF